ncbi:MAG: adenosylcobinamide-GDP ribazoletransferase [Thermoleophilia bacterium]|nr:adenosylcobinamide-GDP ribazoletransferase [Thermoleophilia bacterium]
MIGAVRPFFSALRFLTCVPVPGGWAGDEKDLRRGLLFFPVVGLLIGGVAAAACFGLDQVLPPLAGSAFVVCLLIAVSRALHMDGLADTADGLLSSRSREQMLTIMRDSHTGAMGVVAVACVILTKTALLACVSPPGSRWQVVLLMPLAGRCAVIVTMGVFSYSRTGGGLATVFALKGARRLLLPLWAAAVLMAAGWLLADVQGLVAGAASIATGIVIGAYCHRKIGGYTGDTLGATSEVVECVPALVGALQVWG